MSESNQYPLDLVQAYLHTSNKLKKFERVIFKKLAPNVAEVSNEFNRLAVKFEDAHIFQYAGMCYIGAAKCQKSLGNSPAEIDFLLKSARAFVNANKEIEKLHLRSNNRGYIEGALKSFDQVLEKLSNDSVLKASVIREIKTINGKYENTSSFSSRSHRIFDLELSSVESIKRKDYVSALEKLTDIFDNINEWKKESLYKDVLCKTEITTLLLLLILNIPPSRQSASHIKLIEKYSTLDTDNWPVESSDDWRFGVLSELQFCCRDLVVSWLEKNRKSLLKSVQEILKFSSIEPEHRLLLDELIRIYNT